MTIKGQAIATANSNGSGYDDADAGFWLFIGVGWSVDLAVGRMGRCREWGPCDRVRVDWGQYRRMRVREPISAGWRLDWLSYFARGRSHHLWG